MCLNVSQSVSNCLNVSQVVSMCLNVSQFVLVYSRRHPKYSRLTLLLYPSLSCSKGLWDVRRLIGYKPFCYLAFSLAVEHQTPSAGEGAGIYFHPTSALHLQELTDPLHRVDRYTLLIYLLVLPYLCTLELVQMIRHSLLHK
jgi:hypothetical protein